MKLEASMSATYSTFSKYKYEPRSSHVWGSSIITKSQLRVSMCLTKVKCVLVEWCVHLGRCRVCFFCSTISTTKITTCGRLAWRYTCKGKICGRLWLVQTTPSKNAKVLWKLKIKAVKTMFTIETSVKEEMLEHIKRVYRHTEGSMGIFGVILSDRHILLYYRH